MNFRQLAQRIFGRSPDNPDLDSWRQLDSKFAEQPYRYVIQCVLATLTIFTILMLLDTVRQTVLIAALGASSFIAFALPNNRYSRPRYLVGGSIIGVMIGCVMSILLAGFDFALPISRSSLEIMFGALAMGFAMFAMVVSDTEHPPAAALALGFVLNDWDLLTIVVVLLGVMATSLVKEILKPWLMDLI